MKIELSTDLTTEWPVEDFITPRVEYDSGKGTLVVTYATHDGSGDTEPDDTCELTEFRTQDERDEFIEAEKERVGDDRVFIVEVYRHSGSHYSLVAEGNYPDRRWDVSPSCVLVVEDLWASEPRNQAKAWLEYYNMLVAGEVFGIIRETFNADGDNWLPYHCEAVWGYVGTEYTQSCIKEGIW